MKLLIITQKADKDDKLYWGFFHRWLLEFAQICEKLTVICLFEGAHNLPGNTRVLSLGKENGVSKLKYIWRFYKYIWQERKNYDAIFVHMNPIYFVLGGLFWKLSGKRTALWYVHRSVDLKLRIANLFAQKIFTVSKETYNLPSEKVKIVGHGIPLDVFEKPGNLKRKDGKFRIISVGRITPIKNLDILIEAVAIIKKDIPEIEAVIVGGPMKEGDNEYFEKLKKIVKEKNLKEQIIFTGGIVYDKIKEYYWDSDISVNLCPTGGVDKAVLESMASGLCAFASNKAFEAYFGKYKDDLMFKERDAKDLADKILKFIRSEDKDIIKDYLLRVVREKASLESLIKNVVRQLE